MRTLILMLALSLLMSACVDTVPTDTMNTEPDDPIGDVEDVTPGEEDATNPPSDEGSGTDDPNEEPQDTTQEASPAPEPLEAPQDSTIDADSSDGLRAGTIRVLDSTMHSISIEWDVNGDVDDDATSRVRLREAGEPGWTDSMPLLRIDSTYPDQLTGYGRPSQESFDMFAGSIMFLTPDTEYELWLDIEDPDGGSATRVRTVTTDPYPERSDGCTRTVTPSTFNDAYDDAGAGDVLCLENGNYGDVRADRGGSQGSYLALVAADGAEPRFDRIRVETDHLWIEGMTFDTPQTYGAIRASAPSENVAIVRNTLEGSFYSINMGSDATSWYVVDNTITGHGPEIGTFEGEGIEMGTTRGHTIAFNTIRKTADAVSYGSGNIDFFGNDVYRMGDDGIEADKGYANKRYWGNRIVDSYNYALSFQPMYVGPYYFLYNEIRQSDWTRQDRSTSAWGGTIFKLNGYVDRFVLAHNTFVHEDASPIAQPRLKMLFSTYSRNNLYAVEGAPVWEHDAWSASTTIMGSSFYENDWRTDIDYDAFAWSGSSGFEWDEQSYDSVSAFADAVGIEENAIRFSTSDFERYPIDLRPRASAPIVDSAALIAGVNDAYVGSAPDRGAYEYGADQMPIGAGPEATRRERHAYWERN